jgi:tetrahydromethanopterin S-methyltransferase subunit F
MSYCPDCGEELADGVKFCSNCGIEIDPETDTESVETAVSDAEEADQVTEADDGLDTGRAITSGVMGILVGAVVAFAFTNIGGTSILFIISLLGVGYFLYSREETIKLVAGTGLYIMAIWMPLSPILFYIPLAGAADQNTAAGAGQAIGSVFGMFIYGFIGLIIGLVLAAVGYFLRKGERGKPQIDSG